MRTCNYQDSPDRAAELLRLALPLMYRHKVTTNPRNIALFYEYVAGSNALLTERMDEVLAQGNGLSSEASGALFRKYILQDEGSLEQIRAVLAKMVMDIQQQIQDTGGGLPGYLDTLTQFADLLDSGRPLSDEQVGRVLQETQTTRKSQTRLQQELSAVSAEVEALRRELQQVREESMLDALTGIANRRSFDHALARVVEESPEHAELFCVLLADIDHFKKFNDSYGHLIGDRVIRFVARCFRNAIKGKDLAARFGGEEFAVLLPEVMLGNAKHLAEQIRQSVAAGVLKDTTSDKCYGRVTISIGVAKYKRGETLEELLGRADKALYRAKQMGRDRVVAAPCTSVLRDSLETMTITQSNA